MTDYVITPHALFEMKRRGLNEETIRVVMSSPEQQSEVRAGRKVFQSRIPTMGNPPRPYLVRVFVDTDRQPAEVVTAYRTRKIAKYWKGEL